MCANKWQLEIKVKLVTFVESDSKAPFLIATTPRCKREYYSFPLIAPLYPWYAPYNTRCYQVPFFKSLVRLILELNLVSQAIDEHSTHERNRPIW